MSASLVSSNTTFAQDIERITREKKIEYIDAVMIWCQAKNVDLEYAAKLIKRDPALKGKIQAEGENLNILKKSARLPI